VAGKGKVPAVPDEEFLTVAEIATTLKLNQQTIRNRLEQGKIARYHLGQGGRRVRIRRSDFHASLAVLDPDRAPPEAPPSIWDGHVAPPLTPGAGLVTSWAPGRSSWPAPSSASAHDQVHTGYSSSQAAANHLARGMALELAADKICVNALVPTATDNAMLPFFTVLRTLRTRASGLLRASGWDVLSCLQTWRRRHCVSLLTKATSSPGRSSGRWRPEHPITGCGCPRNRICASERSSRSRGAQSRMR
jgi:excisionase family DNA binding protein